jgi:anaerobic ribonucleoside-triphosphate reductase activating protein
VWVQGCTIRCPGCFNPHLWTSRGGQRITPAELADTVLAAGADGVTLLGGEPFEQAGALAQVAKRVQDAGRSVMTFSGYSLAELRSAVAAGRDDVADLLAHTDLLAAGPFRADRIDTVRPWVGSTNQELVLLSDRFPDLLAELDETPDRVEVTVSASGEVSVNGWATPDSLDALLIGLNSRRARAAGR